MPRKKDVIKEAIIEEEKSYFLPRFFAFLLDMVLVGLLVSCVSVVLPGHDKVEKFQTEFNEIQNTFYQGNMELDEFLNKSIDVVYDIDYNNVPSTIVQVVVLIGYFVIFQYYNNGQTLGKKITKIKVISCKNDELTLNQLAIRALIIYGIWLSIVSLGLVLFTSRSSYFYSIMPLQAISFIIDICSLLFVLFRQDGKGLHDLVGSTKVVKVEY